MNSDLVPIRLGSIPVTVENSDGLKGMINYDQNKRTVISHNQQSLSRQTPQAQKEPGVPAKPVSFANEDIGCKPLPGGRGPYRVNRVCQTESGVSVRPASECSAIGQTRNALGHKPVGQLPSSGIYSHESHSGYEKIRKYSLMMGLVNELKDKENSSGNQSVAKQDHRLVNNLKQYFASDQFHEKAVYKVSFTLDESGSKINLEFGRTLPVTQSTPQPEEINVFASAFSGKDKGSPGSPDAICIEIDELTNEELFEAIIDKIGLLKQAGAHDSELALYVRFRRHPPLDQDVLTYPGYRFVAGLGDPGQAYVSDTLRISGEGEELLYIEFQIPLIVLISADLDQIFDKTKEYPSTIKKFDKNNDTPGSINNRNNREMIHSKTITIVRNMEQTAPEKNVFNDDYIGSGIAQKVSVNGAYPSTVLKFLSKRIESEVEATIVINTLNVMQALTRMIMESAVSGKNNAPEICFSPVDYLMVVDQEVIDEETDKSGSDSLQLPVLSRRYHSNSESKQFYEMVNIPVKGELTFEDESKGLSDSDMSSDEDIQSQEEYRAVQSARQLNKKGKVIWVAGMQRRYDKKQMVENILQDPDESPDIKIEIVKGLINAVDCFARFNQAIEVKGGSQFKCIIDANFGNFAFDRVGHRLIYLDVAPATTSLNGQVLPGNQFMVNWFTSRHKFVYKLSTDVQMSKLFFLVLVTNQLKKLKAQARLYKDERVRDENLNRRVSELDYVVGIISDQLSGNDEFMRWCDVNLLHFLKTTVTADMLDGDARNKFYSQAACCFESYMNNESCKNDTELLTRDLTVAQNIKLLRLIAEVAAGYLAGIKRDERGLSTNSVKKVGLLSKGVDNKKRLSDFEVRNLVKTMADYKVKHFLSKPDSESGSFYDVVLKWLEQYEFTNPGFKNDSELPLDNVGKFKETITGNGPGMTNGLYLQGKEKTVSLPFILKKLDTFLSKKIDVLLIEPFSGARGEVRTVQYKWDVASDGSHVIVLNEYSGVGALKSLMDMKPKTLILVNHRGNDRYAMGDVGAFYWSSVSLGGQKTEKFLKFNPELPLEYEQEKTGVCEQAIFEKMVLALKTLYIYRTAKAASEQEKLTFSNGEFLKSIISWIPENCVEWRAKGAGEEGCDEKESALIKMELSSSDMFFFKPLLRGYSDMIRSELGKEDCSRLYMVMYFPEAGKYVRWMLRVTTRADQELSYMNFRGPFTLADLKKDIRISTEDRSSQLDFMFINGGYGYSSGNFYLHKVPEITVQSGYNDDFFGKIENDHPEGPAKPETAGKDFYDGSDVRDDTDNIPSLELGERVFLIN